MPQEHVTLHTRDGECPTVVVTPEGLGPWPAVIFYMDGFGIRPGMLQMAATVASGGYLVLVPDLFYRAGRYQALVPKDVFAGGDVRAVIGPLMASTDNRKAGEDDTRAFLDYLDTRRDVAGPLVGTVGFCMGGAMAITAAGIYPDRVAATVSFHGGNLATDDPKSPHLLAPRIRAELYVAAADQDQSYPPEMAARMEKALSDAGVRHHAEVYPGAKHGWMKPDFPIHDEAAAARGWREMFALFDRALKPA